MNCPHEDKETLICSRRTQHWLKDMQLVEGKSHHEVSDRWIATFEVQL